MSYPNFEKLVEVIKKLRHPEDGCPWDLKQTHSSLLKYLLEESYEYMHAVEQGDLKQMEEELGDVLLQVVLHSVIAEETGGFNIESVSKVLAEKMIRRHPHVFDSSENNIPVEEIKKAWEEIKQEEKKEEKKYYIDHEDTIFPALHSAHKIGKKTTKVNFDWDDHQQVIYKVEEEWQEMKEELAPGVGVNKERVEEELGDFLFSIAQLARHLDINPEDALRKANKKFVKRFNTVEDILNEKSESFEQKTQMELDSYWEEAKRREKYNK